MDIKQIGQPSGVLLTELRGCENCAHRVGSNPTYWRCGRYGGRFAEFVALHCNVRFWAPRPPRVSWWRRLLGRMA